MRGTSAVPKDPKTRLSEKNTLSMNTAKARVARAR
jgi:hypothetical protein